MTYYCDDISYDADVTYDRRRDIVGHDLRCHESYIVGPRSHGPPAGPGPGDSDLQSVTVIMIMMIMTRRRTRMSYSESDS